MTCVTALKIELAIELCVCEYVCARLPCLYWKQL